MTQELEVITGMDLIEEALELLEDEISLFDLVKKVIPRLSDTCIKNHIVFIVNGEKVEDSSFLITNNDDVSIVPIFAGG